MTKTVAIYGFSPRTRHHIHDSEAPEVWTLNNAYKPEYEAPLDRITRWYELHSDWQIFSDRVDDKHFEWLSKEHPFPIFMQEKRSEFPKSVKFPLDEIIQNVDGGRRYLTNSIALMVAHAIYEQVDRIELYGIDLEYGTEYAYQKAGTEYVIGVAIGRGIDIYFPNGCALLNAPIYAYDAHTQTISKDQLLEHLNYYRSKLDELTAEYMPLRDKYINDGDTDALMQMQKMNPDLWLWDGAQTAINILMSKYVTNGIIGRQSLEREHKTMMNDLMKSQGDANLFRGKISILNDLGITNGKSQEIFSEYEKHVERVHTIDGMSQAVGKLIKLIDFRAFDMDIKHSVKAR